MTIRCRFAPSPTGSPHVGNIRTALFNWLFARKNGGVFIARLEDTDRDPLRYQPESIADIERSLAFLGIEPDEWWKSPGSEDIYTQSHRLPLYTRAAESLLQSGNAYRCYCTPERLAEMRAIQQERGLPPGYDRRCRGLTASDIAQHEADESPSTVRLRVPLEGRSEYHDLVYGDIAFENRLIDDQVLLKSNGWPTYHLAVVVDDHDQNITHVLRGEDWLPSTPKQIMLYKAFGWQQPVWVHLPLIVGKDRKKLGKRHGSTSMVEFIDQGYLPEAMFNFLVLLGWSAGDENREIFSAQEILQRFALEGIVNHSGVFDYDKLRWMNGEYIRAAAPQRLAELILPHLQRAGLVGTPPTDSESAIMAQAGPLITDRMKLTSEAPGLSEFFFKDPTTPEEKGRRKWLTSADSVDLLDAVHAELSSSETITQESAEVAIDTVAQVTGMERARIIHTVRLAITGRTVGPGLFELMVVLGRQTVCSRLATAKGWVQPEG